MILAENATRARIDAPEALIHIIGRGFERREIFRNNTDSNTGARGWHWKDNRARIGFVFIEQTGYPNAFMQDRASKPWSDSVWDLSEKNFPKSSSRRIWWHAKDKPVFQKPSQAFFFLITLVLSSSFSISSGICREIRDKKALNEKVETFLEAH
jgi:hypothetical protein